MAGRNYAEIGEQWALDVDHGNVVAGELVRLACRRHLDELERSKTDPAYPYYFDPAKAGLPCRAIELLPHIKGVWAARHELIRLEPWQVFSIVVPFGWLHKDNNRRRITSVYEEVARKNAKTTKAAGIALYLTTMDNEHGAEVFAAATKKDQARIVFDLARKMSERSQAFRRHFGVKVMQHRILQTETASEFKPLDAQANTQDGLNVHGCINDELHAWKSRHLMEVIETGKGAREQPLTWNITTAGSDTSSLCYEMRTHAVRVLKGKVEDDSLFSLIFTLDQDDDWKDPKNWVKANPNLGVSVSERNMHEEFKKALSQPTKRPGFKTKKLNLWVNADTEFMDMEKWRANGDDGLRLEDFEGWDCIIGVDLASKIDLAAKVYVFWKGKDVFVFAEYYLPEQTVKRSPNSQYQGWADQGLVVATPGNIIDYDRIEAGLVGYRDTGDGLGLDRTEFDGIKPDIERFRVREIVFDPWHATQLMTRCQKAIRAAGKKTEVVELRATVRNYSEPMKEVEAMTLASQLKHDNNPITEWNVGNVVCHRDKKENIFPNKQNEGNKIDGFVAMISAINRMLVVRGKRKPKVGMDVV